MLPLLPSWLKSKEREGGRERRWRREIFHVFLPTRYFDSYEDVGKFGDLSLLDYLGDAVLLSNRLAFLSKHEDTNSHRECVCVCLVGKYRDFHREYTYGNYEAAGQLLVNLLTSGITLKKQVTANLYFMSSSSFLSLSLIRYWLTLLTDSLPLLQMNDKVSKCMYSPILVAILGSVTNTCSV